MKNVLLLRKKHHITRNTIHYHLRNMIWASGSATAEEANVASIYYWKCIHSTEILQICHSPQSHLITIQTNMCCNCISFSLYLCLYLLLRSSDCSWETKCSKSEYASCPLGLFKSLSSFFHPNIFFDYIFFKYVLYMLSLDYRWETELPNLPSSRNIV